MSSITLTTLLSHQVMKLCGRLTQNTKQNKGNGYTKGFVSCNARATNDFKHKNTWCIQ